MDGNFNVNQLNNHFCSIANKIVLEISHMPKRPIDLGSVIFDDNRRFSFKDTPEIEV